jgi:tRNA (guanine-N7-)-methyltransferase
MAPNQELSEAREELLAKAHGFRRIECDFGSAKGKFLSESAAMNPCVFFAGIEGLSVRVARCNRKIDRLGLSNAAVWRGWGKEALDALVPDGFLDVLHVSFPDPWPKRRHWFRRLVNPDFLKIARRKLKEEGILRLMTDHLGYFSEMKEDLSVMGGWEEVPWEDDLKRPITEFETIFLAKGDSIGRIAVRRRMQTGRVMGMSALLPIQLSQNPSSPFAYHLKTKNPGK